MNNKTPESNNKIYKAIMIKIPITINPLINSIKLINMINSNDIIYLIYYSYWYINVDFVY